MTCFFLAGVGCIFFLGGCWFRSITNLRDWRIFDFQRYISRRIQFWNMFVHLRRSLLFKFQGPCNSGLFFFCVERYRKVQAQKVVDSNQMTQAMLDYLIWDLFPWYIPKLIAFQQLNRTKKSIILVAFKPHSRNWESSRVKPKGVDPNQWNLREFEAFSAGNMESHVPSTNWRCFEKNHPNLVRKLRKWKVPWK